MTDEGVQLLIVVMLVLEIIMIGCLAIVFFL